MFLLYWLQWLLVSFPAHTHFKMVAFAVGYVRTSSMTNVGEGKDSAKRQMLAITTYAANAGYSLSEANIFAEEGVKGDTPLVMRPEFHKMLQHCQKHHIDTIIFEDSSRFCRGLVVQEIGFKELTGAGYKLISAANPHQFLSNDAEAIFIRQMLGAVSEYQKNSTVHKLSGARQRAAIAKGKFSIITKQLKPSGRNSQLEGPHKDAIEAALLQFAGQETLSNQEAKAIASHLESIGLTSKAGKPIAISVIRTWFKAMKSYVD